MLTGFKASWATQHAPSQVAVRPVSKPGRKRDVRKELILTHQKAKCQVSDLHRETNSLLGQSQTFAKEVTQKGQ